MFIMSRCITAVMTFIRKRLKIVSSRSKKLRRVKISVKHLIECLQPRKTNVAKFLYDESKPIKQNVH